AELLQAPKVDVLHAWVRSLVLDLMSPPRKRIDLAIQAAMGVLPSITTAAELGERQLDLAGRLEVDKRTVQRWTEEGLRLVARRLLDTPDRAGIQRSIAQAQ